MNHAVSLHELERKDSWITMAQFLFYVDAMHYAQWLSDIDMHGRTVRVDTNDVPNAWLRNGKEVKEEA